MKIGIDLDGVILDTERGFRVFAELKDIELKKENLKNENEWAIEDRFNWTKKEIENFWDEYIEKITMDSSILVGFKEVFEKLKSQGHILILNTSRGVDDYYCNNELLGKIIKCAKKRLENENIVFDKEFWAVANKGIICKNEGIDLMIDDSMSNCQKVSGQKVHVLYLRDNISKEIKDNKYVHEVHNWGEIYRYIQNCSKIKTMRGE